MVTSAVTNLDLHDIARACRTYGVLRFYVVTPLPDQRALAQKIVAHWTDGPGGARNPDRCQALSLVRVREGLDRVKAEIEDKEGARPRTVATDAREREQTLDFSALGDLLATGKPVLILLGTAWGLTPETLDAADHILAPIRSGTGYNHLSVRSAAAIILDRLLGQ